MRLGDDFGQEMSRRPFCKSGGSGGPFAGLMDALHPLPPCAGRYTKRTISFQGNLCGLTTDSKEYIKRYTISIEKIRHQNRNVFCDSRTHSTHSLTAFIYNFLKYNNFLQIQEQAYRILKEQVNNYFFISNPRKQCFYLEKKFNMVGASPPVYPQPLKNILGRTIWEGGAEVFLRKKFPRRGGGDVFEEY